ncbi:MAG: radical SAM protein [Candidatus Eremiobacterota bacterium]
MLIALCNMAPMEHKEGDFVPIKKPITYRTPCPYNIYLLASIMEQGGYEISIKDWTGKNFEISDMIEELLSFDVIMISVNSWNWYTSACLMEKLRSVRDDQIFVVGGIQATLFGQKILEEYPVDYAVRGEAEKSVIPLLRLIEKKAKPEEVPGLVYKENGEIKLNPVSPLMTPEEISLLPVPLYEKLPEGTHRWLSIESSRGCVNRCSYCSVPYQKNWRPLSAKSFVNNIEAYIPYLVKVGTGKFLFIDDSFIIDVNRAREIAKRLREKQIDIKAIWNGHIMELREEEMLSELDPYTEAILVGAESFHEETLKKIGKHFKPEDILKGTEGAVKIGMGKKLLFSFIIGFPWQNKDMILEEIDKIYSLICRSGSCALINWLILSPGSPMWNEFYRKKQVSLRNYRKLYEAWKEEVFPLSDREVEEINSYIKSLQNTIPGGTYRFQPVHGINTIMEKVFPDK